MLLGDLGLQLTSQGPYGHGKPGEIMEFKNGYLQAWKSPCKQI